MQLFWLTAQTRAAKPLETPCVALVVQLRRAGVDPVGATVVSRYVLPRRAAASKKIN